MYHRCQDATGVTLGRGIESFIQEYDDDGIRFTSMEIATYSYSRNDGAFSAPKDSGSIVADDKERIVGILTGDAGLTGSTDVTYVSPYYWVEERIKAVFPNAHLHPIGEPVSFIFLLLPAPIQSSGSDASPYINTRTFS